MLLQPLRPTKVFEDDIVDWDGVCAGIQASQLCHTLNPRGFRNLFHPTTIRQQVAARNLDSHEILQRDTITRKHLDRIDASSILQNIAHTNVPHGHTTTTAESNELIGIKAELIKESDRLSDGTIECRLTRLDSRVQDTHQHGEDADQSHEDGTNASHQLVHLAHRIRQLAKDGGHNAQETIPNALDRTPQTLKRIRNALEHLQECAKELIDRIQNEARLILEGLHRTACEVPGDTHADHSRKGHLHGVTPLLNPVLLEFIQLRQDPELGRQQKCDHRCRHKDDEVHCHENGLIPVQEITFGGVKMESMSLLELKQLAKAKRIKQYYIMRRAQLIELLSMEALPQPLVLEKMTVTELREEAKRRGMRGFWRRSKEELLQLLYPSPQENQKDESHTKKHNEPECHDPQDVGVEGTKDSLEERLQNMNL